MHGVELDGVFLGVPFRRHCDGQSLTGDGEELGLRRFQLAVVQVYFKASWGSKQKSWGIKEEQALGNNRQPRGGERGISSFPPAAC